MSETFKPMQEPLQFSVSADHKDRDALVTMIGPVNGSPAIRKILLARDHPDWRASLSEIAAWRVHPPGRTAAEREDIAGHLDVAVKRHVALISSELSSGFSVTYEPGAGVQVTVGLLLEAGTQLLSQANLPIPHESVADVAAAPATRGIRSAVRRWQRGRGSKNFRACLGRLVDSPSG